MDINLQGGGFRGILPISLNSSALQKIKDELNSTIHMDWEQALSKYGINFSVEKRPIFVQSGEASREVKNVFALVRNDTGMPFEGVSVNTRYTVIQTSKYANIGNAIVSELRAKYVDGGEFKDGRLVYLQAELPDPIVISPEDKLFKTLLFVNSFDGTKNFTIVPFLRRSINNTYMSLSDTCEGFTSDIKHTPSSSEKINKTYQLTLKVLNCFSEFEEHLIGLMDKELTAQDFETIMRVVLDIDLDAPYSSLSTKTQNRMEKCREILVASKASAMYGLSAWSFYSAFVEFADKAKTIAEKTDEKENQVLGSGAVFKKKVLREIEKFIQSK
jgi:phage/plasmid-like protein (TIGR03299 family)